MAHVRASEPHLFRPEMRPIILQPHPGLTSVRLLAIFSRLSSTPKKRMTLGLKCNLFLTILLGTNMLQFESEHGENKFYPEMSQQNFI